MVPAILVATVPGAIILSLAKTRFDAIEWISLSLALSLGFMVSISVLTQFVTRLDQVSVAATFLGACFFLVLMGRFTGIHLKDSIPEVKRHHVLFLVPIGLSLYYWHSAFGIHSIDMGWHGFWAQQVIDTGHLPNYAILEPFDQSSRFVFGPHMILALFGLLSNTTPDAIFWLPLAAYSVGTTAALYSVANRLTKSPYPGLAASILYSVAYLPGGYIQRGNLPDIMGFFVLITTMYLLTVGEATFRQRGIGGFLFVMTFALHPYAAMVVSVVLALCGASWLLGHRKEALALVKTHASLGRIVTATLPGLATAIVILPSLGYINARTASQIRGIDWSGYVPNPSQYGAIFGLLTLSLALAGTITLLLRPTVNRLVPLFWLGTLLTFANSPLIGLGLEPVRFVWRMVEPFSLLGGIFLSALLGIIQVRKSAFRLRSPLLGWRSFEASASAVIIGIVLYLALSPLIYAPSAYSVPQADYESDLVVGKWLLNSGHLHGRVAVDVEYDNTATWIMYYANYPMFLYRVNFAARVAPEPYRQVYQDLGILFDNPLSISTLDTLSRYALQYIVTSVPDKSLFYQSPFLTAAFSYGSTVVFATHTLDSYGVVTESAGWLLPTVSGLRVALLKSLSIDYNTSSPVTIDIPVFSHITDPPIPDTAFLAVVDGQSSVSVHIPQGSATDAQLNYTKFWPFLTSSSVGVRYDLKLELGAGSHRMTITSSSDSDFEIYSISLRQLGISFDVRGLHQ